MPVYEYRCSGCGLKFEKLIFSQRVAVCCPGCTGTEVVRCPSVFGMSGVERQSGSSGSCSSCSAKSCSSCGSR